MERNETKFQTQKIQESEPKRSNTIRVVQGHFLSGKYKLT